MIKLNSNIKVLLQNKDNVLPQLSVEDYTVRSVSFTPESNKKINDLRKKYKISRSAVIRILLEQVIA